MISPKRTNAIAASLCILWAVVAPASEPLPLRLMTYNIRLDLASDGINSWPHRREWVAAQIVWLHPDIFGLQEVQPNQKSELAADLPQYRLFGGGRDDGKEKARPHRWASTPGDLIFSMAACSGCRRHRQCPREAGMRRTTGSRPGRDCGFMGRGA
jgi:hypothetical protein